MRDTPDHYEYHGMLASTWDLLRGDTSGWSDRPFYRQVIEESGQPALDVGCGTGRLLLDYLSEGIEVDGVDNSPEMLDLCRQKADTLGLKPGLHLQTMETLDLPRRYRTIIVPSSSFQLLTSPTDAVTAMRRFLKHLEPGGTLVMPFMLLGPHEGGVEWYVTETPNPADGTIIRRSERSQYDEEAQLESTETLYEVLRNGEVVHTERHSRSPATRWYTQEQAVALYTDARFTDVRVTREFTFEPATPEDRVFCVHGTRP